MIEISKYIFFTLVLLTTATLECHSQIEEENANNSLFYYSGSFDNTEKLEFNLQVKGLKVSGSVIVVETGELYIFSGRMSSDKSGMGVYVYDNENHYVAAMEAKFISEYADFAKEIRGVWKAEKENRQRKVSLKKVAELADTDILDPEPLEG